MTKGMQKVTKKEQKVQQKEKKPGNNYIPNINILHKYHTKENNSFFNNQKIEPYTPSNNKDLDNRAPQRKNNSLNKGNHLIKENDFINKNPQISSISFSHKGKTIYPTYRYRQRNQILNQDIYNAIINKNIREEQRKKIYNTKLEDCQEGEYKESSESGFEKKSKSLYSHHSQIDEIINYYNSSFQKKVQKNL